MYTKYLEFYSINKIGTSETLRNEIVMTTENVKPISVHRVMDWITTWVRVKFRGHLKALVTKVLEETLRLALLMVRGMVTSLEIDLLIKKIGNRGSKSDLVCKRATSIRLFSITYLYCKMYSSRRETGYWEKIISTIFWIYILLVISIFVLVGFSPGLGLELFNLYYLGSPYNNLNTIYLRRNYSTLARGVCSKKKSLLHYWFGWWRSFGIYFTKYSKSRAGYLIQPNFQITLHKNDYALLEAIKEFFMGVGGI